MISDLNRKRLEWMAYKAQAGDQFPDELFETQQDRMSWAQAMTDMARAAIDEIDRLKTLTIYHAWEPVETVPIEPHNPNSYNAPFRCLVQHETGYVEQAEAYWVELPRTKGTERPVVMRWRSRTGVCQPKYWMPLPAAKED